MREKLIEKARKICSKVDGQAPAKILLTEGADPRMQEAAAKISAAGFARVTLSQEPLEVSAAAVRDGQFDGAVSGAMNTSADVIRTGIKVLGTKPGIKTVSSIFLMLLKNGRAVTYADCGVVPYPTAAQLADIAISSAQTHQRLTGETPIVAMLSFSTLGSADHERVKLVREALEIVRTQDAQLLIDGELQFDAAFVPEIAKRKAPNSAVAGQANVFIFPNLDAGNIAYKITERVGEAVALGPILQGLNGSWMDLSRGCSADDIYLVTAISALLA